MRYAIISDIHSNLPALQAVMAVIDQNGVDQIVCLGDVVGPALTNVWPNECIELLRERNVVTVRGNHDALAIEHDQPFGFNERALEKLHELREQLTEDSRAWLFSLPMTFKFGGCSAFHATQENYIPYLFTWNDVAPHLRVAMECGLKICFFGHTHEPAVYSSNGLEPSVSPYVLRDSETYFINPGSVGQPRGRDFRPSFGLYDSTSATHRLIRMPHLAL